MTPLSKPQKKEDGKIALYLSKEVFLAQRLIPEAKESSLKAMGTLAKCPVGQKKEKLKTEMCQDESLGHHLSCSQQPARVKISLLFTGYKMQKKI